VAPDDPKLAAAVAAAAQAAKVDAATVGAWARAATLETALRTHLLAGWLATPARQVRGQEFVVGPSSISGSAGPWVDLVALDPSLLGAADLPSPMPGPIATPLTPGPGATPSSSPGASIAPDHSLTNPPLTPGADRAAAVATWLRAQPEARRLADVLRLAAAANADGGAGSDRSGELGYLTRRQVVASVGAEAFAPGRTTGDVLGPLTVDGHALIFYVEGRYAAALDNRSAGALTELGAPGADPVSLSAAFAPDRTSLAIDAGWWSSEEFAQGDPSGEALFGTALGTLSDPVSLAGDLALFRPTATRTELPDPAIAARLTVEGYANWFAAQRAQARIELAANPLPEAYPSVTSTPPGPPTLAPLPTPVVPGLPGATSALPSANPFEVPTLPGG
jgi:hypothetical protein